jgi:UTP:GlnB (protein PII) uridylyltransferase
LKPFVESVLYPLWDAGLKVGHQVRSERDQLRACKDDLQTLTATLTGRAIAGHVEWGDGVVGACARAAGKRRAAVLSELAARPRPGSPWLLEPDLKNGAGGRRDYDELVWSAALVSGRRCSDPSALVGAGILSPVELVSITHASDFVAAARWMVQLSGARDTGLTTELAAELGIDNGLHKALADTAVTLLTARARLAGSEWPPILPLAPGEIIESLARGAVSVDQLEIRASLGALDHLIEGFSALMCLRRPGLTHRYTVGSHSIRTAASLADICREAQGGVAQSCEQCTDIPALTIAALVHDVGKRSGGTDHPRAGAEPAHDAALRFGLRPSRAQDVSDLVRLHLALIEAATRYDIDDEDTVLRAASHIGRRELVAPLHLLTVADSTATGPETWGPWQEALVGALVARLDAALSPEVDGAGMATLGESVRTEALTEAARNVTWDPGVSRFLSAASLRYLSTRTPTDVIADAQLVASYLPGGEPVGAKALVRAAQTPGTWSVAVAAADRPELFARVAGALSLSGLDILGAEATGTHDGVALDVFTVRSATLAGVSSELWARFDRYLKAALTDRLELEVRLAERRRHYPTVARIAPHVELDSSSGYGTLVRVQASDRVGLLYDLAHAISHEQLDIRWAKALTANGIAIDTFLVVGPDGSAPTDHGALGHLSMGLRAVL